MLDELVVRNLGIIAGATLEPGPGLVVVTGETGTGKTVLLGALRLLRGGQARADLIGPHGDEAAVEARFWTEDDEITAARRITANRSRAYRDGSLVSARALSNAIEPLVEIVGQHDHLALGRPAAVRRLLDEFVADGIVEEYQATWEALVALRAEAETGDSRSLERELEVARHQADEIEAAGFTEADEEALATAAQRLRNAESIADGIAVALDALNGEGAALDRLESVLVSMQRVERLDPTLSDTAAAMGDTVEQLRELSAQLGRHTESLDHDPATLAHLEQRLAHLGDLKRKYGSTLAEVLRFADQAQQRAADLTRLISRADNLAAELAAVSERAETAGGRLRSAREAAARQLSANSVKHLQDLGFRRPVVSIMVRAAGIGPHGADAVAIEFASDDSLTPGPVAKVASGGELSRLVLALRLAAGVGEAPIVAFDEIDAGIGGATALAMGRKLAALGRDRQVLCVTHLPQVAAFAESHFVVERKSSTAIVRSVDGQDRLEELSRMLAGLPESEKGKGHAAELLALAGRPIE